MQNLLMVLVLLVIGCGNHDHECKKIGPDQGEKVFLAYFEGIANKNLNELKTSFPGTISYMKAA